MSQLTLPQSENAKIALSALSELQERFRVGLDHLSKIHGDHRPLIKSSWFRDQGQHGGGWRWGHVDAGILNRGSLNISTVHYDDLPNKRLSSATALSCIVHPSAPRAPSLHTHISWTELRSGSGGGWRLMADLNPSYLIESDRDRFISRVDSSLASLPIKWLENAKAQGDRYFMIPSLDRHRGVAHYYVEQWKTEDAESDLSLALRFGECVIDTYLEILDQSLTRLPSDVPMATETRQLEYHSLYFLQVLTLDRGTSSGLLVHSQNDEGIMGSLPQRVNRALLRSWIPRLPKPQDQLLTKLCDTLICHDETDICTLDKAHRVALAQVVREHYQAYPEALALQARGDVLPPTVANHSSERSSV